METSAWVSLARILRPQGRKGEVLAELFTDFPERFSEKKRVFLASSAFCGSEAEVRAVEIASFWLPIGRNEGRIVIHFTGTDTIEAAEVLSGLDVLVPRSERIELGDDASYISDLIGCALYDCVDPGHPLNVGTVIDVQFTTTPDGGRRLEDAASLLVLDTVSGEVLVPFVKAFLISIDPSEKRINMSLPSGLIEINRRS